MCYLFFGSLLEPHKCYVRGYLLSPAKAQRIYIPKYLSLLMEYYEAIISYFKYIFKNHTHAQQVILFQTMNSTVTCFHIAVAMLDVCGPCD